MIMQLINKQNTTISLTSFTSFQIIYFISFKPINEDNLYKLTAVVFYFEFIIETHAVKNRVQNYGVRINK